jgi:glycosyltransferase involved in cell wall biosynthesis
VLDRLARGLGKLGHDVTLFTTGDSTCAVDRRWAFDRPPDRIGDAVTEIQHVVAAYHELQTMDVVHDHTNVGPLYAWRFTDLPVVATNHGPFDEALTTTYRAAQDRVALVAISHHQASTARNLRIDAVIHHGVDPEAFPVGRGDGGFALFLGRMAPEKGAREAALAARRAGIPLLMAAKLREPTEHAYFDAEVKPLLGDGIEYLGEVPHDEKLALLENAHALLNPIQWPEPFGLVMIEALASGTPVLAFPNGAAPEIVDDGETGFLCADTDMMSRRIPDVCRLSRSSCRAAVERRFSTARMCEEHVALFNKLIPDADHLSSNATPEHLTQTDVSRNIDPPRRLLRWRGRDGLSRASTGTIRPWPL